MCVCSCAIVLLIWLAFFDCSCSCFAAWPNVLESQRRLRLLLLFFIVPSLSDLPFRTTFSRSLSLSLAVLSPHSAALPTVSVCLALANGFVCGLVVLKLRASLCLAPLLLLPQLLLLLLLLLAPLTPCIPLFPLFPFTFSQRHSTLINATFACCSCPAAGPAAAPCPLSMSTCTFISVCCSLCPSLPLRLPRSHSSSALQLRICLLA